MFTLFVQWVVSSDNKLSGRSFIIGGAVIGIHFVQIWPATVKYEIIRKRRLSVYLIVNAKILL